MGEEFTLLTKQSWGAKGRKQLTQSEPSSSHSRSSLNIHVLILCSVSCIFSGCNVCIYKIITFLFFNILTVQIAKLTLALDWNHMLVLLYYSYSIDSFKGGWHWVFGPVLVANLTVGSLYFLKYVPTLKLLGCAKNTAEQGDMWGERWSEKCG